MRTNQFSLPDLITLAQCGDQEAITELYNRTYSAVYHTAKALIRDEDTVQDVLQDAYIKGFQNLDKLRQPEQYQAWMKIIAANTAKNVLKRKMPILFSEMENEDGEMEVEFVDDRVEHLPDIVMDRKETSRLVSEILDTLPDDQRLVMGMFYYEEMSVQLIARTLGVSENTVKSRLNYGRKKVEAKVRDLEKRGTRLYSLAPLPFLLLLLSVDASAEAVPSAAILEAVTAKCAVASFGAGSSFTAATETARTASAGGKFAAQSAKGAKSAAKAGVGAVGKTAAKAAVKGGAKALGLKIAAGVLAAGVVCGGAAAAIAITGSAPEKTPPVVETMPPVQASAPAALPLPSEPDAAELAHRSSEAASAAYLHVLGDYTQVLSMDSDTFLLNPDRYFNGDHMAVYNYHSRGNTELLYAFYDIDRDGAEELLIGVDDPGDEMTPACRGIVDVYGFDGGQAAELLDENILGSWRSELTLHRDGRLHFTASPGAGEHYDVWYTLQGGTLVPGGPSDAPEVTDISWEKLMPARSEPAAQTAAASPADAAFTQILQEYAAAWNEPAAGRDYGAFVTFMHNKYPDLPSGTDFWNHVEYGSCILRYAYHDLNGDGIDELFIDIANDESPVYANVLEGFYFDGQKAVRMGREIGVLSDGVIVQIDEYGGIQALKVLTANGLEDYRGSTALRIGVLWGPQDISGHGGDMQFAWKNIDTISAGSSSAPAAQLSFDSIRADIRAACKVTDYNSNLAYYDALYSHLGNGVMWLLCNRDVPPSLGIGATTYNVFCVEFDIDGDGELELCVAKGVTPQHTPQMIAIYDRTASNITPIFGDAVFSYLEPYEYGELPVNITQWEYLT